MSGLTLGLLQLDTVDLEVLRRSGTERERRHAARIEPVRVCRGGARGRLAGRVSWIGVVMHHQCIVGGRGRQCALAEAGGGRHAPFVPFFFTDPPTPTGRLPPAPPPRHPRPRQRGRHGGAPHLPGSVDRPGDRGCSLNHCRPALRRSRAPSHLLPLRSGRRRLLCLVCAGVDGGVVAHRGPVGCHSGRSAGRRRDSPLPPCPVEGTSRRPRRRRRPGRQPHRRRDRRHPGRAGFVVQDGCPLFNTFGQNLCPARRRPPGRRHTGQSRRLRPLPHPGAHPRPQRGCRGHVACERADLGRLHAPPPASATSTCAPSPSCGPTPDCTTC